MGTEKVKEEGDVEKLEWEELGGRKKRLKQMGDKKQKYEQIKQGEEGNKRI